MTEVKKREYKVIDQYGDIRIETFGNSYHLRWSHGGRRYSRVVGKICPEALRVARAKAQIINSDILMDRFDLTLYKYFPPRVIVATKSTGEQLNLINLWERYKIAKKKLVAATTQKGDWREVDRALVAVKPEALEFTTAAATLFLGELLDRYAGSTTRKVLENIRAANFWAIEEELLSKNFYSRLFKSIPRSQKSGRSRKCFERHEIEHILAAFTSDEFRSKFSTVHSHSYYRGYAEFLALTGFRPEEAIALTWSDIKDGEIVVSRAYSQGVLKATKTYETRSFPINSQLAQLLRSVPNSSNLVFPSVEGGYINQQRFNERYWKLIVKKLVQAGKVAEYLPTNNLRHSWITRMLKSGLDIATVARLAGNKPDTIMRHYWAAQTRDLILPEL